MLVDSIAIIVVFIFSLVDALKDRRCTIEGELQ
jgi:hypothetical protein